MTEKTEIVDFGAFEPQIHFSYSTVVKWRKNKISLANLSKALEELRIRVKEASGYTWDNGHFFIDDVCGMPAIEFAVTADSFSMWEANHNTSIGDFTSIPNDLSVMVNEHIAAGAVRCSECGGWFGEGKWVSYSFAGAVCNKDYDPAKHKGPDSSG